MKSFRVGRLFGIPIELDLTLLLVLPLFAYIIGVQVGRWTGILNDFLGAGIGEGALTGAAAVSFTLGSMAAVGLFVGVVVHELGHSLVARHYGIEIASIRLWLFGGVAQLKEMPEDWRKEFNIAIAGPIVSVVVGAVAYLLFLVVPAGDGLILLSTKFLLGYLALMNLGLAAFNMLPGFPMDGGRVLRALWARNRPYAQATRMAARVGQAFAIFLGLFGLFGGGGIFLVAIAFFIYIGASSESQQTTMRAALEGVTVRDVMTPRKQVDTVTRETTVAELVTRMFRERHTGYPVMEAGHVVGLVTLADAQRVPEVERDAYLVGDVMSDELVTIGPDADAMEAIATMQENGIGRLVVMEGSDAPFARESDREFVGFVSRTDLMTALDIIQSSGTLGEAESRRSTVTADREPRFDGND